MRVLTARDARSMAEIHAVSFERGWDALEMSRHISKDICLGLGDPLSCFIICARAADQADILTIATHPDARRQGLGATLLNATLTHLAQTNISTIFLDVAEDNHSAIALYKKAGFQAIGRRPAYYKREKGRIAALNFSKVLDVDALSD